MRDDFSNYIRSVWVQQPLMRSGNIALSKQPGPDLTAPASIYERTTNMMIKNVCMKCGGETL